jgi:hypothetical protein
MYQSPVRPIQKKGHARWLFGRGEKSAIPAGKHRFLALAAGRGGRHADDNLVG